MTVGNFYTDVLCKSDRFHSRDRVADPGLLEPGTRRKVKAILADAAAHGIDLAIYETYRSQELQEVYYERGVTRLRRVGVHHYGLACDIVHLVNGEPSWKGDFNILGHLAKAHGLVWGGDWGRPDLPHSFRDYDHVQRCSIAQQAALFAGSWYPPE